MSIRPEQAFILAAGRGNRLRPYTDHCPKPLVKVAGRPIIDHVLDRLVEAGVGRVAVNIHYMADMMEAHLATRKDVEIVISREDELLDTGGGLKNGLKLLNNAPFYGVSGDWVWQDTPGVQPALHALADKWDEGRMDLLLQLLPLEKIPLTVAVGDYHFGNDGRITRARDQKGTHMWNSVRICTKGLFEDTPDVPFSFLELMDRSEVRGRLYGAAHEGEWHHITSAEDLDRVNAAFSGAALKAGQK